jgi:hypothetical protein
VSVSVTNCRVKSPDVPRRPPVLIRQRARAMDVLVKMAGIKDRTTNLDLEWVLCPVKDQIRREIASPAPGPSTPLLFDPNLPDW